MARWSSGQGGPLAVQRSAVRVQTTVVPFAIQQANEAFIRGLELVNRGYQHDDLEIVDYKLYPLGDLTHRGPPVDFAAPYFSSIGAAQVFGRFVDEPFPTTIGRSLGLQSFNVGMSGAGASFFSQRPKLIETINKGKFAIVHLMSGRSLSNSVVKVGQNQGTLTVRSKKDGRPRFAETVYDELLRSEPPEEMVCLRQENRNIYVQQMRDLLTSITVPKVLLYWSTRSPEYKEGTSNIESYWGGFPHFVNREVVNSLLAHADQYVECVTARGLPQPVRSLKTGDPIVLWAEDKFPNVKLRHHNHYYPSPEMNKDVADALLPACREVIAEPPKTRPAAKRHIIVHLHIFKNAGSSFDKSLQESFGERWLPIDPPDPHTTLTIDTLRANQAIKAMSSHQVRFFFPEQPDLKIYPIVFLRHPLIRTQSIYEYERSEWRSSTSSLIHTKMAREMSFRDWVKWCLSRAGYAGPIANYQTRMCSITNNGQMQGDWLKAVMMENFQEALTCLGSAYVGTVENYNASIIRIEARLRGHFPDLILSPFIENSTSGPENITGRSVVAIRDSLGADIYEKLCAANSYDLMLWKLFSV